VGIGRAFGDLSVRNGAGKGARKVADMADYEG
jgi:hypothetical protein